MRKEQKQGLDLTSLKLVFTLLKPRLEMCCSVPSAKTAHWRVFAFIRGQAHFLEIKVNTPVRLPVLAVEHGS